ncbi:GAF domain-containing protein [Neorhodopirellula lusitana]|uniref:GAF domain-containing protein n=1 Tax=Neorhodopirellula lusitana TaxID=445327 RepID=UPI00384AD097
MLKRLAQGASLDEVLHTLVEVAEESRPGLIASVLLLDTESGRLRNGASRQLPQFYCDAVDGVMPGPQVGSCGTAVYTGKRVIVEDISTNPLWEQTKEVALKASLRACWSEPIVGTGGEVLGTFAMYYREPRAPDASDINFVASSANLAALAIQRLRYQQEVEHERAVLKAIVLGTPDALLLANLDREITHTSAGACRMFGYEEHELVGKLTSILYADQADFEHQGQERFCPDRASKWQPSEITWRRKSGETFPGEIIGAVVRDDDGSPIGTMGMIRDVSERKAAEAKLTESQNRLVQAERLAAMGQMVSAIAHESRNALQRIQVSVEMLRYELKEGTEARSDLERISRAEQDLVHLHDELRSFAGPIRLSLSTGSLADAWREAWSNLHVSRGDHESVLTEIVDDVELTFQFDAFRMQQVFRNLFENSLAACEGPTRILITARQAMISGEPALQISVRDNGPGIQPELVDRVFEAFHTTKAKGTGLGMAIAKRFVTAHRGSIEVVYPTQTGAEFLITLLTKTE